MDGGDIKQKRCFPKASLLENSQVNLQHGRCKLTKRRCCVEPPPSVAGEERQVLNSRTNNENMWDLVAEMYKFRV